MTPTEAGAAYAGGESIKALAARTGHAKATLRRWIVSAGFTIQRTQAKQRDPSDALILRRYKAGASIKQIAAELGRSFCFVQKRLWWLRVPLRSRGAQPKQPFRVVEDFFDPPHGEGAIYWAGFLAADGTSLDRAARTPEVKLNLAEEDCAHVATFRDTIAPGKHISREPPRKPEHQAQHVVRVSSRRLAAALAQYFGVTPRKSATYTPPDLDGLAAVWFWRGMIDGDGAVEQRSKNGVTITFSGSTMAVRAFVAWATTVLSRDDVPRIRLVQSTTATVTYSPLRGANALAAALYDGAQVALARKRDVWDRWRAQYGVREEARR